MCFETHGGRSNSTGSHIDMKKSPISSPISSHALRLSSPTCTVTSDRSPVASYSAAQSGVSPVAIIDETTSDVPLTSLMSGSFVPKIENDSGMFTISSILRENASAVMHEKPSLIDERSSMMSRLDEDTSTMMSATTMIGGSQILNEGPSTSRNNEGSSSVLPQMLRKKQTLLEPPRIITEQISLDRQQAEQSQLNERVQLLNERSPSMIEETSLMEGNNSPLLMNKSPLINEETVTMLESPRLMSKKTMMNQSPLLHESSMTERPPMMNEKTSLIMNHSPLMAEASTSVVNRPAMINARPSSVVLNGATIMNDGAAISSSNACLTRGGKLPANYFPNGKNAVTDMNWGYNQETYTNEANIENWLGQIFKTDNLIAGCSLPQD